MDAQITFRMFFLFPCYCLTSCTGEKVAPLGAVLQGPRSCYLWGLWPGCSEMCLCQLPFDLFPYYSNPLIPDLATFHRRTSQTVALLHRLGSPVASSNFNDKTALFSSPWVLKVAEFLAVVSGAWLPPLFPEPASASLCYWTCFCSLQVWRKPKFACGNYCACFPLSCLCSPPLRTFSCPSSLSCIFSRLGRNGFSSPDPKMKWKQVQGMNYPWAAVRLLIYFYIANFWRCKSLPKEQWALLMQSPLCPCSGHIWGDCFKYVLPPLPCFSFPRGQVAEVMTVQVDRTDTPWTQHCKASLQA